MIKEATLKHQESMCIGLICRAIKSKDRAAIKNSVSHCRNKIKTYQAKQVISLLLGDRKITDEDTLDTAIEWYNRLLKYIETPYTVREIHRSGGTSDGSYSIRDSMDLSRPSESGDYR